MKIPTLFSAVFLIGIMAAKAGPKDPLTNHIVLNEAAGIHLSLAYYDDVAHDYNLNGKEIFADKRPYWILDRTSTNFGHIAFIGMSNQFDVKLWNKDRVEVPKTAKGKAMSVGPPSLSKAPDGSRYIGPFLPGDVEARDFPKVEELFQIPADGEYILEVRYWVWDWEKERYLLSNPVRLKVTKRPAGVTGIGITNAVKK
jgi:hypothetical protein